MDAQTVVIGAIVFLVVYYLWIVVKSTRKAMREEEEGTKASGAKQPQQNGKQNPEKEKKGTPILDRVIEIVVIVAIVALFASCSTNCSGQRRRNSDIDYSERAQELGTSTDEYRNTYNYWRYRNP